MAFVNANLHLRAGAPGDLTYTFDAVADTLLAVGAAGYFNNTDDAINLVAEDLIFVQAIDGNCWLRVSSVSSGIVTTQFAGGNLPVGIPSTNTASAPGPSAELAQDMAIGHYEVGTAVSSATRYVLPTPYAGAEMMVIGGDSGEELIVVDAGGSGATGVTYNATGDRRFTLNNEGEYFHVVGVSATRWRIQSMNYIATLSGSTAPNTAFARFLGGTA